MTKKPIVVVAGEEREMNDSEYEQYLLDQENAAKEKKQKLAEFTAKEAAQAKLAALGLTADDLKALGL
jgi:hypothetical protein